MRIKDRKNMQSLSDRFQKTIINKITALIILAVLGQMITGSLCAINQLSAKPFSIGTKTVNSMEIQFKMPDFQIDDVATDGTIYHKIRIDESGYLIETGMPELPILTTTIAIPNHGQVQVEIIDSHQKTIQHIMPYPSQDGNIEDAPRGFSINQAFYSGSDIYPQEIIKYSDPQILRDFRIITIQIQPFAWNAITHELIVRDRVSFRLNYNNTPGVNELEGPQVISPSFKNTYEANILNFDDYRDAMIANTPPQYLIIYGNYTDQTFLNKVNEFAFWKKQKGAEVRLVSTAITGNSNAAIKAYIQNLYNDINSRPDFVILIGDTSGSFPIPTWTETFSSYNGSGDYPYQHLAGNDYLGDVFLGRISAENTSQLDVLFSKIYFYEKNINVNTAQWLNRMLLVSDTDNNGISDVYLAHYIRELSLLHNPDYTYTMLAMSSPAPSAMNQAINQGVGFFNYRGYAGMSGWNPGSSLINGTKLPHALIITCNTGIFEGGAATSELFTRLGTAAVPAGAITATGMSTGGTHTMFNNTLSMGVFAGIFTYNMRTMGEAILSSKLVLHELYSQTRPTQVKYFTHWLNLIGDPTVEVYCRIPDTFVPNVPTTLPKGTSYLDMTITNQNSAPVQDACVTVSRDEIIIARGYTDSNGWIYLMFNTALDTGTAVVTVSKHDFKPLQTTITVEAAGSLVGATPMIDDDNVGNSIGNGNYSANSGETLEVSFSVRNTTVQMINSVTGYVSCSSPYVTIIDSVMDFANINANSSNYSLTPVLLQIVPTCTNNTTIRFDLHLTDNNNSNYVVPTYILVSDAFINFISYQIIDGVDQVLDPGETADFSITVKNNGTVPINGLYGQLLTMNDLVSVVDNVGYFGNILVGTQVSSLADMFQLMGRPQMLSGTLIPMRMKLYNDSGFLQWVEFILTIGSVTSTDPLGPDAYGYVIYDITDTSYEDCPAYDWIGIAPAEGGQGTQIPITDTGTTSDEGDLVDAQSLAVVDLPFPFTFYGISYNQITVCSNGFIVLGVTGNGNYRNSRLPGSAAGGCGTPSSLIAPFWDDLITTGGGIYKWYDGTNHLFIIEWYNCKNGFVQTAVETFQVILYDPVYYPTSLGDGPIKIQYNTFNNVDVGSSVLDEYSGNYSTIGIQNYDQTIGLEYSFNNTYPTAAAPLGNQNALFITNAPVYHNTPHLSYDGVYVLDDNNNIVEPGETLDLYVNLMNIGQQTAQNINTTVSCYSSYLTLLNSISSYPDIEGYELGTNILPFTFSVSDDCPDQQVLHFIIQITTDINFWQYTFNLIVEKPILMLHSFIVNDATGNNNGGADPGENIVLVVNIKNDSLVDAHMVSGVLSSTSSDVLINTPVQQFPVIAAGEIMQFTYQVAVNSATVHGINIPFNLNLTSTDTPVVNQNFFVACGLGGTILDFESFNGNFVSTGGWEFGAPEQTTPHSGNNLWCTGLSEPYANDAMYILTTPSITLSTNPVMTFWHMLECQNYYDGGNVSISTDGGSMWTLLYPLGGYNNSLSIYSLGEVGYTNYVGWSQATFNLSAYAGSDVIIRWRFGSNSSGQGLGWFIDDVMISGYYFTPGKVTGNVTLASNFSQTFVKLMTGDNITTTPNAAGDYAMYLPQGIYTLTAKLDYHVSQTSPVFELSNQQFAYIYDFDLEFLSYPTGLELSGAVGDSIVYLTWIAPITTIYPVQGYKIYRKFNNHPYQQVGISAAASYTEGLQNDGTYNYYVRAVYGIGEGAPSEVETVAFPFVYDGDNTTPLLVNALNPNYPNPFNPVTTISYSIAKPSQVSLKVYNIKGQLVKTLDYGSKKAGQYKVIWNGLNDAGRPVSSGLYFFRLQAPGYTKTRKMMMLK